MRIALFVVAATLFAAESHAQARNDRFVSGNWLGRAYYRDSGQFVSCSMHARYRSGIKLYFGLTRRGRFRVGFWKSGWSLDDGSRQRVALLIDRRRIFAGEARVASTRESSMVYVDLPLSRRMLEQFRGGYVLHVDAPTGRMGFSLAGSSEALVRLVKCVANRLDRRRGPTTQPADRRAPRSDDRADPSASDRVRAVTLIANVLSRAAVGQYAILGPKEIPRHWRRFHALWRAGKSIGLVRLYHGSRSRTGRAIYSAAAGADFDRCKGAYQSGVKRGDRPGDPVTFFSRCSGKLDWSIFYVLVGPDSDGTTYLVGLFSPDKNEPLALGERIRRALTAIVLKKPGTARKEPETFEQ
ncbi:MAG: hypothetical protein RLT05_07250 [Bauldia litoralis]